MSRIILTGATSGIGAFLARSLEGELWLSGRRENPSDVPVGARYRACDLTSWHQVRRWASEVGTTWGRVGSLIHCAGVQGPIGPTMDLDPTEWVNALRANVESTFWVVRAFYPLLRNSGDGRAKVILFSGGGASTARPNFSAYAAAKTAIVRLAETWAQEWSNEPIDVNAVAPGAMNTAMTSAILDAGPERVGSEYTRVLDQIKRGGDSPDALLRLIRFLLSSESDGLTGRFLSAQWDDLNHLRSFAANGPAGSDLYTLRRMVPAG